MNTVSTYTIWNGGKWPPLYCSTGEFLVRLVRTWNCFVCNKVYFFFDITEWARWFCVFSFSLFLFLLALTPLHTNTILYSSRSPLCFGVDLPPITAMRGSNPLVLYDHPAARWHKNTLTSPPPPTSYGYITPFKPPFQFPLNILTGFRQKIKEMSTRFKKRVRNLCNLKTDNCVKYDLSAKHDYH